MRMFIPRKPHVTGVKLYVLADSAAPYVVDMYMLLGQVSHPGCSQIRLRRTVHMTRGGEPLGRASAIPYYTCVRQFLRQLHDS